MLNKTRNKFNSVILFGIVVDCVVLYTLNKYAITHHFLNTYAGLHSGQDQVYIGWMIISNVDVVVINSLSQS